LGRIRKSIQVLSVDARRSVHENLRSVARGCTRVSRLGRDSCLEFGRAFVDFPVFLATIGFATCWTATLWDLDFVENPTTVWDILKFAFLGAYAFTVRPSARVG
jgi:hypothetical protein